MTKICDRKTFAEQLTTLAEHYKELTGKEMPKIYRPPEGRYSRQNLQYAKAMGYKKVITYILESENGASLKASNFVCEGIAGGLHWTGSRNKGQDIPSEMKTRWVRCFE
jgi:peptidoglycan/xylan/chitin deacetylase (PgdA/CDA1 family)